MSRRKDTSPHRRPSGGKTDQSEPGNAKSYHTTTSNNQNNYRGSSRDDREGSSNDTSDYNRNSHDCRQNMTPEESVRRRVRGPTDPDISFSGENGKSINRTGISPLTEAGNAGLSTASRFAEKAPTLPFGAKRTNIHNTITTSTTPVEIRTTRNSSVPDDTNSPASMKFGIQRNHTNQPATISPTFMKTGTQINNAFTQRNTDNTTFREVEPIPSDTDSNNSNLASASTVVTLKSPKQEEDSNANTTDGQQKKVEKKPNDSNSADDDSELRKFFLCPICCSDRIRHWRLIPCGHLLCVSCERKLSDCPFCRTPVEGCERIRFAFE